MVHPKTAPVLVADIGGRWADYSLMFGWRDEVATLHFACACDLRIADVRRSAVYEMLSLVNDQMPLGHFTIDPDSSLRLLERLISERGFSLLLISDDPRMHARMDRHLHVSEGAPRSHEAA